MKRHTIWALAALVAILGGCWQPTGSDDGIAGGPDGPAPDVTTGLVAYYPFSGDAGDASGNGNDGTVSNATLATDRHGATGSAYLFNGTDSRITVSAPSGSSLNDLPTERDAGEIDVVDRRLIPQVATEACAKPSSACRAASAERARASENVGSPAVTAAQMPLA